MKLGKEELRSVMQSHQRTPMSHKSLSVLIATSTDRLVVTREAKVQTDCCRCTHGQFFTDHAKTHDYTGLPNVKLD